MSSPRRSLRQTLCSVLPTLVLGVLAVGAAPELGAQVRPDSTRTPVGSPTQQSGPPGAEMAQQQGEMLAMAPMMGQMMAVMFQSRLAVLALPETADQMATFTKNYYDALIAKGFSREDAMRIVLAHGVPTVPTGR